MNIEIWKQITDFPDYQISNFGRIKSFKGYGQIEILEPIKDKDGYFKICLYKNGKQNIKRIHILLYENFNDYKLKKNDIIHHKDGNKINNFLNNLQLMNRLNHNKLHRKKQYGQNSPNHILIENDIIQIRKIYNEGNLTQKEIGKIFGVSQAQISDIVLRKSWKNIGDLL